MEKKETRPSAPEKFEKKKKKKKWLIVLICALAAVGVFVAVAYGFFHHYYSMMGSVEDLPVKPQESNPSVTITPETDSQPEDGDSPDLTPSPLEEIQKIEENLRKNLEEMEANSELYQTDALNILLLGVDSRSDDLSGRTDCMILTSINKKTKQITMTSFLRDIYCSIPGYTETRLNEAYAYGGTQMLVDTIKANFGISVDRCIVVNFYLVMDLVDALGGIDLELSSDEIRVMNMYIKGHNKLLGNPEQNDILSESDAGTIHVNGNQALAYARVRYVGMDFARTGRQRTVISKCLDKIKTLKIRELLDLAEEFLPRVHTDLTQGDCAMLLMMMLNLSDYELQSLTVPVDGSWNFADINGMDVISIDFARNAQAWHDLVENGSAK